MIERRPDMSDPSDGTDRGLLGRRGPYVFVDDVTMPVLDADDAHHLTRVLRLRPGAPLTIGDGRGSWCDARFGAGATVELAGAVREERPAIHQVHIAFALVKGSRPELVVQKLTELGVDRISPFVAARSVVRWEDARGERHHERLEKVARSASMQSHRAWLPTVDPVQRFADLASQGAGLAAPGGGPLPWPCATVLVGPEGGWSDDERGSALPVYGLGPTILRAETAAIAVGVLLTAMRAEHARPVA